MRRRNLLGLLSELVIRVGGTYNHSELSFTMPNNRKYYWDDIIRDITFLSKKELKND